MNKDQVKGVVKDATGKLQEKVGQVTGNKTEQAKGLGKQVAGAAQKAYGDAKEAFKHAGKKP